MLVNIYEAKTRLSALLERARTGEDIVIAKAGKPMVRLVPIAPAANTRSGVRFGGLDPAKLKLTRDFHSPMRDEDLIGE